MHIVYVSREYIPTLRGGGIASYLKEVAEYLVENGHQVTVVAANDDTLGINGREFRVNGKVLGADQMENGVRVIRLIGGDFVIPGVERPFFFRRLRQKYRFLSYRKRVAECIKGLRNIDVIEVAEYGAESLFIDKNIAPITIRLHTPSLFDRNSEGLVKKTIRNFWVYSNMMLEVKLIKECENITSCSENLKLWVLNNLKVEGERIEVIHNPVNYQKLIGGKENAVLRKESLNVVFVGTICDSKGCGELIEACKILKKKYPKLELWLFGKRGIWADALESDNREYKWINFYGKIDREYLYSIYKHADLICLPSWWDNLPMTCIEGMMSGGLILGSNAGGMAEIIKDGKNGFLVTPKDVNILAEKMDEIMQMKDELKNQIRQTAKDDAVMRYSTDIVVGKLLNYYNRITKR